MCVQMEKSEIRSNFSSPTLNFYKLVTIDFLKGIRDGLRNESIPERIV